MISDDSHNSRYAKKVSIAPMFVTNLEPIGSSSRIKDTKYHFFLKMAKDPCLNTVEEYPLQW